MTIAKLKHWRASSALYAPQAAPYGDPRLSESNNSSTLCAKATIHPGGRGFARMDVAQRGF
jgi:hypothetical protein